MSPAKPSTIQTARPEAEAAEVKRLFSALADVTRIRIVNMLSAGELCVCDIVELLEVPQSTASRHLAVLREEGLVVVERRGRFAHYRLAPSADRGEQGLLADLRTAIGRREGLEREREWAARRSTARLAEPCER